MSQMYRDIIFDLDGTLTDSGRGIINSVIYALEKLGYPVLPQETLRRFVGPPLAGSFMKYCGMTETEANEGVRLFRERYVPVGWRENRVYPGIRPLLRELKKRGARLYVATGKSEESALKVLQYFGLISYLDGVAAPKPQELNADKARLILSVCPDTSEAVMVGDTAGDLEAARASGAAGIAVSYGYGVFQEDQLEKTECLARTPFELSRILLGEVPAEKGLFISLEGLDGCGKTTQRDKARSILEDLGYETVMTREPGGCPISEEIRSLLLSVSHQEMTATAEALLYAASRAQHVHDVILPAVRGGKAVICDRFVDSSLAYQGGGRSLGLDTVYQYNEAGVNGCMPDVTVYFRIDHETSLSRRYSASQPDRMEQADTAFFERAERAFEMLAEKNPDRFLVLDGRKTKQEVSAELEDRLPAFLCEKGLI